MIPSIISRRSNIPGKGVILLVFLILSRFFILMVFPYWFIILCTVVHGFALCTVMNEFWPSGLLLLVLILQATLIIQNCPRHFFSLLKSISFSYRFIDTS